MVDVCLYFQVHQPYRMKQYSIFQIGKDKKYFDDPKNGAVLRKVASKCYIPANNVMLELLDKHPEFKVSYSLSGTVIDQLEDYAPEVLDSFRTLADTKRVEFLNETYYHSLSFLYSKEEFVEQVKMHHNKIKSLFGVTPEVFRNTELIYNNELGNFVEKMGFKGVLCEGADHVLGWRNPNFVYKPKGAGRIKLMLKNYKLSDDVAFRFSERSWKDWPLTAEKYGQWINAINGNGNCLNLFMDYETLGEHQWADTGIFNFMRKVPEEVLRNPDNGFATPSELINKYKAMDEIDVHNMMSWADVERDLSAWLGNSMQKSAISKLYEVEKSVKESGDPKILEDWRKLTTSDHLYYMCTKWFADGDVHKYFNPYDSPYDSFINFMNILNDIYLRINDKKALIKIS